MPIYQYQCPKCNFRFDLRQNFSDDAAGDCPQCQTRARRLFTPVPIIFKGSGFYVTDHARKSEAQQSPKSEKLSTDSETAATSEKSSDIAKEKTAVTAAKEVSSKTD
jgi:putative FmdB family regulatory protein